jgi:serine protease Do
VAVWVLIVMMLLPMLTPMTMAKAEGNTATFRDVTMYQEEIEYLANLNIIKGYQDGTFRPTATVTRLQAVQMILRGLGVTIENVPNVSFKDLKPGEYGYDEVAMAVKLGFVSGKNDGSFDPYGKLTRAQMAKMFATAFNLAGKHSTDFTDVKQGHWAYDYVHALAANEVTTGYPDGSFRPNDPIKRMHFALFMARYMNDEFKPPVTNPLTLKEVIAKQESVVMIHVYDENNEEISQGSGFVATNGLIVTNFHVISGGTLFEAETHNGETFEIEGVVDYDFDDDIAILKPYERLPLKPLKIGSKDMVEQGDEIVAIGSPLGFSNSASVGIVSGIRTFEWEDWQADFIQFTAPVTYGSSGGPLLNMYGYVVGLISFGFDLGELNFALAADHVKELLSPYITVPFYQLSVIPVDELPVYDFEEETIETERFYLDERLVEAIIHPSLPIIYGIDYSGNIVEINYETQEVKSIPMPLPAERLYFANDELYVTLLKGQHSPYWQEEDQEGAIAIVDTATFTLKEQFDIALDPFDIVADDKYIYVSSGSGQLTYIKSYDRVTKQEVDSEWIQNASYLEMHPNKTMIYAITTDLSPRDISVYTISDGQFTGSYDSPYHGEYEMEPAMTISDDGKYIFNHFGIVFRSTPLKSTNMTYVTEIFPFTSIAFDQGSKTFYTGYENELTMYDNTSFELLDYWYVDGMIDHVFFRNGKIIMLTTEQPYSNDVEVQSVQIFDPSTLTAAAKKSNKPFPFIKR